MGVPNSARAAAVGISTAYKNFNVGSVSLLQQHVAVFAQGSESVTYSDKKFTITSSLEVAEKMGYGSPAHLIARELFPDYGVGAVGALVTVYPLLDGDSAVKSNSTITMTGKQTTAGQYSIRAGGIDSKSFVVMQNEEAAAVAPKIVQAVNSELNMPVTAEMLELDKVVLRSKHTGTTGNDIVIDILGEPQGLTFSATNMAGGLVDPSIDGALSQVGSSWVTMIVNQLGKIAHDDLLAFGASRWGTLEHKPLVAFYGSSESDPSVLAEYTATRALDNVNSVIVAPDSVSLPWIIAGDAVAEIARSACEDPAVEYRTMVLGSVVNGSDGAQWNYAQRDIAWKAGISSTIIEDGVVKLDNTLTHYHPEGKVDPEYGKVIYIVKLQNIIYNINLLFNSDEYKRAVLIPDGDISSNINARKPSDVKAALSVMANNLSDKAIISDPAFTKKAMTCEIDGSNPNRVNTTFPVKLSGNWDIHNIDVLFGFYLGGQ